jgi:hypothetical protein
VKAETKRTDKTQVFADRDIAPRVVQILQQKSIGHVAGRSSFAGRSVRLQTKILNNEKLVNLYGSTSLVMIMKSGRLRTQLTCRKEEMHT